LQSSSHRSVQNNPEIIFVESKSLQFKGRVEDYTEMTDTVKPSRYKNFTNYKAKHG